MQSGNPTVYLGPKLLSGLVEGVLMGVILKQTEVFLSRVDRERRSLVALVVGVFVVALFQTLTGFYSVWEVCVAHYPDWIAIIGFTWPDRIQSTITVCLAVPVQIFLVRRCWILMHRAWYIIVIFAILLLASVVSSLYMTIVVLSIPDSWWQDQTRPMKFPLSPAFILTLVSPAVLDVGVSGILLVYLAKSRSSVHSSRFRRVMRRLTQLVWEAALPPCICATITLFLYIYEASHSYWDLSFQAILGKLYVISLFVTLNGRAELREDSTLPVAACNCHCHAPSYNISNLLTPPSQIRLDISGDSHMSMSANPSPTVADDSSSSSPEVHDDKDDDCEKIEAPCA